MTVNLAWRDAVAEVGGAFTKAEQSAGWAETLTPWQIAMLQRPWKRGDRDGRGKCDALHKELEAACVAGVLAHTTTEVEKLVMKGGRITISDIDGGRRFLGGTLGNLPVVYTRPPEYKTDTQHHITAEAFAAWLAANDIEPSRHVAAWFKSQAVDTDRRTIAPPEGWKAQSPHGMQRIDATDAGRLVRLADVVQWLMDTRELPCKNAVEEVCSTLEPRSSAAAGWLYLLTETGYAKPLPPEHSFYYLPMWTGDEPSQRGEADDWGLVGAVKYMREYWGQSPAPGAGKWMGQHVLDPLAIRIEAAHLLWGYGRRVEATEQPQAAAPAAPMVAAAPTVPVKGVMGMDKEQREDARLDYCIKEGLQFHKDPLRPLPYGIGEVAKKLGLTRPSLSTDVKNALKRKAERERPKPKLVTRKN